MPGIKKLCFDNGVTKSKLHAMKLEQEEIESTETADSGEAQPTRRTRQRSKEKEKVGEIAVDEEDIFDSSKKSRAMRKSK